MFEDVLVPLLLTKTVGQVKGKTRFQKLMFLVKRHAEKEGVKGINFDFQIYLYGPFSHDLSREIYDLVRQGFIVERTEQTCSNYEMHLYKLSKKGEDFLEAARSKELVSTKIACIINDVVTTYSTLPLPQLVKEAYKQF